MRRSLYNREVVVLDGYRGLKVYQGAYSLGLELHQITRSFPREERYALTDQIRRSSRSVAANIAEGYRKKRYPRAYLSKLADADGELAETQVWLDFARDLGYLHVEQHAVLAQRYEEVGRMLAGLVASVADTEV